MEEASFSRTRGYEQEAVLDDIALGSPIPPSAVVVNDLNRSIAERVQVPLNESHLLATQVVAASSGASGHCAS